MRAYKLTALKKQVIADVKKREKETVSFMDDYTTVKEVKDCWRMKQFLTPWSKKHNWDSFNDIKRYLVDRIKKNYEKELQKSLSHFNAVLSSGKLIEATISVEWKKNRTWGANPKAEIKGSFEDLNGETKYFYFQSESIGGCGYDKLSTAVAQVVNQVNPILRSLYIAKNKDISAKNRDLIGYGSGYSTLPRLEGGVGVSCYPRIFEAIGYDFETIAGGKSYDVFRIEKS